MSEVIQRAVTRLAQLNIDAPMDRGVVLSVDKNAYSCSVQLVSNDSVLDTVKLKPIVNDNNPDELGLVFFPVVGSYVTVGQIDNDNIDLFVIGFTQIESVSWQTNTSLGLSVTADGKVGFNANTLTLNNGNNGGIPLLKPLVNVILGLQQQVNQLITTFNTHVHPVAGGVTGPTATPGPAVTVKTIKPADIANPVFSQ